MKDIITVIYFAFFANQEIPIDESWEELKQII